MHVLGLLCLFLTIVLMKVEDSCFASKKFKAKRPLGQIEHPQSQSCLLLQFEHRIYILGQFLCLSAQIFQNYAFCRGIDNLVVCCFQFV